MKTRVGVLFGGSTVEHEVSVISALQAIENIDKDKYEIVPIYMTKDKIWYTGKELLKIENYKNIEELIKKCNKVCLCNINDEYCLLKTKGKINKIVNKIDIAFPIVHGKGTEDGSLSGMFETIGIPYVGPGILGSALGQDKVVQKQILENNGINVTKYIWFYDQEYIENKKDILKKIKELEYPVVIKPASLGSSIGINYVKTEKEVEEKIEDALEYDEKVLVEKAVENLIEVNCSVFGNYKNQEISEIEEVMSDNNILTYEDKYIGGNKKGSKANSSKGMVNTSRKIPAHLDKELTDKVKEYSAKTFKILNLSGVCRIDFLINKKTKELYVNEPNVIPGSLSFYLWETKGKKYKDLLTNLIELGLEEYKNKVKKVNSFDSNLFDKYKSGFNSTKGKLK